MKSKAPLSLMEQLVMLLVFALAAALCLQIFVFSGQISRECETRDRAVAVAQNAAETLKATHGDLEAATKLYGGVWQADRWHMGFDEAWQEVPPEEAAYCLVVTMNDSEIPLLGTADVAVQNREAEDVFRISVAWQEGADG